MGAQRIPRGSVNIQLSVFILDPLAARPPLRRHRALAVMIAARAVNAFARRDARVNVIASRALERAVSFRAAVRATERASFASTRCASRRSSARAASATAFLWWSREKEIRKRWKQLCEFAADEIPAASPLGGSKGLIRWVGEYPLTVASVATAVAGGVSAAISAAVLPVVVGVAVLALPGLLLMFVGTAAVASLVGALVLLLSLPALGFLGVFGGSIAAAASAKLLPLASSVPDYYSVPKPSNSASLATETPSGSSRRARAADDPWSPTDANASRRRRGGGLRRDRQGELGRAIPAPWTVNASKSRHHFNR